MNKTPLRLGIIAFFAAIICATSFFRIPIPGITGGIVIQNAMCIMTAVLLGGVWGGLPTALFFVAGIIGLPVFSGGQGGFQVLMNINGGFRIGWVLGAFVSSFIAGIPAPQKNLSAKKIVCLSIAVLVGMLLLYVPEIFYVLGFKGKEMGTVGALKFFLTAYFTPFLLVDFIKAVIVILLSLKIRPIVALYLYEEKNDNSEEK